MCDALLDQPAAEVGIDQTPFGRQQGFDERPYPRRARGAENGRSP